MRRTLHSGRPGAEARRDEAPPPRRRRRRASAGGITLADVARIAGVSPITASRALRKPEIVAPDTVRQVRAAAEQLAYVPNLLAGGLASQRSTLVSAVIPSINNPGFSEMVRALRDRLLEDGYQLTLGVTDYRYRREDELVEAIISRRPDGIVLTGVEHSVRVRRALLNARIPVVETWDLTSTPLDMLVGFSNERVGRAAAEYFIARGRRGLALAVADDSRSLVRRAGFMAAAAERGVTIAGEVIVRAPSTVGMGRDALDRLLAAPRRVDAVFCSSDHLALGVLFGAHARGVAIPERIAVVGFGNQEASAHTYPSLTTVAVNGTEIGTQTARLLLERFGGAPAPARPHIIDVGFRIVQRESA